MTPAEMREMAAKVAQKRADGGLSGECERGHVEYDTGAFVCSSRVGCLCQEREEEAEAIAIEIRALPIPDTTAAGDASIVEAMAKTLARRRSGLTMRHERNAWANCHWPQFTDDARAALATARPSIVTAADEAMEKAREALRGAAETLRRVPRDSGVGDIAWKDAVECELALAAIEAAKAKGGGK